MTEHLILPAIRAEADRLVTPDQVRISESGARERAELEKRKLRVLDMYEAGDIDRDDRVRRLHAIYEGMARLDARTVVKAVPRLDWTWPPRQVNSILRALFAAVQLDPESFQPIAFTWRVPEWRRG